ncbi:MAG: DedA family protein [Cyanobacteria bacterium P01_C01_bin.120]
MLNWITTWIETLGHWGIFCLMILEHLFPPIPSELIMPLAGFVSSDSEALSLGWTITAGISGSMLGTLAWYVLGRLAEERQILAWIERYGHWLSLKPQDIQKAMKFFRHSGGFWIVGVGRIIPGIRTYVSVPAGLSQMPLIPYLSYTFIGTAIWTGALAIAGFFLGNRFEQVQTVIAPISKLVLAATVILIIFWIAQRLYKQRYQRH